MLWFFLYVIRRTRNNGKQILKNGFLYCLKVIKI
jgi:hypothetical protein